MSTHLVGATGVEQPASPEQSIEPAFAGYEIPPASTSEESLALAYGFALSSNMPPDEFHEPVEPVVETVPVYGAPSLGSAIESVDLEGIPSRAIEAPLDPEIEPGTVEHRDPQLAQLLERLACYEAFDSLIQDNISRSADLFRSLYEERERVRSESAGNRAEFEASATLEAERALYVEREKFQTTLMSLMDEARGMQRHIDGLIHRIADAITESTGEQSYRSDAHVERLSA